MRAIVKTWKMAGGLVWEHAIPLIVLNLLWVVASFLIITMGPATLAAYWWIAATVRDGQEKQGFKPFLLALRRYFLKGVVWLVGWAALIWLATIGLQVWAQLLPPLGYALVQVAWTYGILYLVAMQPYLLEYLTVEEKPWGEALRNSAWQVVANPVYSHAQMVIPAVALWLSARYATLASIALVSALLAFWAVAAAEVPWKHGRPRPIERRMEDVL